jgi:hypothetical protein
MEPKNSDLPLIRKGRTRGGAVLCRQIRWRQSGQARLRGDADDAEDRHRQDRGSAARLTCIRRYLAPKLRANRAGAIAG